MVDSLDVLGHVGNDVDGSFVSAIRTVSGDKTNYAIYRAEPRVYPRGLDYAMIPFLDEIDMMRNFSKLYAGGDTWKKTTEGCGFGFSLDDFSKAVGRFKRNSVRD
ncbi:MAG: hypothetical protein AABX94_01745 [Nanoarchaeota archaeon]